MLSRKKDSADISDTVPTFHVRYIGATETFVPNGTGCTTGPLQKLWDNAPSEKHLRKVAIQFSLNGIYMKDMEAKKNNGNSVTWFGMEDISFCAADRTINDRLFAWISKHPVSGKLEVHAVLCSTRDKAQTMAAVLSRAFQLAYRDWKADRQKEMRRKVTSSVTLPEADTDSMTGSLSSANGSVKSLPRSDSAESSSFAKTEALETKRPPD